MDLHQGINNIDDFALMTVNQADDNVVLPIELTNTTGTCLQQLNTHCLMEIFTNNSLTLMDLCSIAETCTRFKEIAENIFPKDFMVSNSDNGNKCKLKSKNYGECWFHIEALEPILKNFGQYITRVSIRNCDKLLKLVAEYCSTGTLERLDIWELRSGQGECFTMNLKSILELTFKSCDLMALVTCPYINCDSLIELYIKSSSGCVAILRSTFPKLERFTFYQNFVFSASLDDSSEILPDFLRRHKHLRSLCLSSDSVCCSSQLMEIIADNCSELTNLTLEWWHSPKTSFNFSHLKNLRKLIMLDICSDLIDHRQLIALLEEVKSLTTLKLRNLEGLPSQTFIVLSQLPNLRELHLECGYFDQIPWSRLTQLKALYFRKSLGEFSSSHVLQIISELTYLEELVFYNREFKLSSKDFSRIVKIVEQRPNKLTLKCLLSKDLANNYDENKNVSLIECTD